MWQTVLTRRGLAWPLCWSGFTQPVTPGGYFICHEEMSRCDRLTVRKERQ